jgi:hypothetical protein
MIERLDETIDRVASALTSVPADPALSAKLRLRLRESSRSSASVTRVLCMAAATMAIAIVGWQFIGRGASSPVERESVNADAAAPSSPGDSAAVLSDARPLVPPSALASAVVADTAGAAEPIAPLVLLEELAVPPVNVAPLEVADLEIVELGGGTEFEEP